MPFSLSLPTDKLTGPLSLTVNVGQMLFILGANGTGKSSIMHAFAYIDFEKTRRINAHRQNWFDSGSPGVTGQQRVAFDKNAKIFEPKATARWKDERPSERVQMAIFDLVNADSMRNRNIALAVERGDQKAVDLLKSTGGPLTIINRVLRLANLGIVISIEKNDEIMAIRSGSSPYSIAKLSDGERNAILIAANVLTVAPGTLLLIDEPERHLHRSIVSPLLSLLLAERPDCAFVVSTHEPLLPVDNGGSQVLLTRSCVYEGDDVKSYDVDLLENTGAIDDDLKQTILGERRKIVFVEGLEHSLDKPLYSLLFPNASVVAKKSCRDVEYAVIGIKDTTELHWVRPFGLVDNDTSEPERLKELRARGVIPLSVYSVESIYYHPAVQKLAGAKMVTVLGGNLNEKLKKASEDAINAIRENSLHLSSRIAEKAARAQVFSLLPKKAEIESGGKRTAEIDFGKFAREEAARLEALVNASDFVGVLQRYPIRESKALNAIAKAIGFYDGSQYEDAVRKLLFDDVDAVKMVRALLGPLPSELVS